MTTPAHLIGRTILDRRTAAARRDRCTCVWDDVEHDAGGYVEFIEYRDPLCPVHKGQLAEEVEFQLHTRDSNPARSG